MPEWYPNKKEELEEFLENVLSQNSQNKDSKNIRINGIIVPHAGYEYSGKIAGKAFSMLKERKVKRAVIFGPSHYASLNGLATIEPKETPFGKPHFSKTPLKKMPHEHSIENQIPFLQKLNPNIEILPIVVGQIDMNEAEHIAREFTKKFAKSGTIFVFSSDLSHFLDYNEAKNKDLSTIHIITSLNEKKINTIDACGIYPLFILFRMCKIKSWGPKLIEYSNSGDITGYKKSVVGYASFYF